MLIWVERGRGRRPRSGLPISLMSGMLNEDILWRSLLEEDDVIDFASMLSCFTLKIRKQNKNLYPPRSMQNLLHGINYLIKARSKLRAVQIDRQTQIIDIFNDPLYAKVKCVGDVAINCAIDSSLGRDVRRFDNLSLAEEVLMLGWLGNQANNPYRANW